MGDRGNEEGEWKWWVVIDCKADVAGDWITTPAATALNPGERNNIHREM